MLTSDHKFDASTSGGNQVAMGIGNQALGPASVAMGKNNKADGSYSLAVGLHNIAKHEGTVALGRGNYAQNQNSVAMGLNNKAIGTATVAIGAENKAHGENSVSMGRANTAYHTGSVAMGFENTAGVDTDGYNQAAESLQTELSNLINREITAHYDSGRRLATVDEPCNAGDKCDLSVLFHRELNARTYPCSGEGCSIHLDPAKCTDCGTPDPITGRLGPPYRDCRTLGLKNTDKTSFGTLTPIVFNDQPNNPKVNNGHCDDQNRVWGFNFKCQEWGFDGGVVGGRCDSTCPDIGNEADCNDPSTGCTWLASLKSTTNKCRSKTICETNFKCKNLPQLLRCNNGADAGKTCTENADCEGDQNTCDLVAAKVQGKCKCSDWGLCVSEWKIGRCLTTTDQTCQKDDDCPDEETCEMQAVLIKYMNKFIQKSI